MVVDNRIKIEHLDKKKVIYNGRIIRRTMKTYALPFPRSIVDKFIDKKLKITVEVVRRHGKKKRKRKK